MIAVGNIVSISTAGWHDGDMLGSIVSIATFGWFTGDLREEDEFSDVVGLDPDWVVVDEDAGSYDGTTDYNEETMIRRRFDEPTTVATDRPNPSNAWVDR